MLAGMTTILEYLKANAYPVDGDGRQLVPLRGGGQLTVLATNGPPSWPIIGFDWLTDTPSKRTAEGRYIGGARQYDNPLDLMPPANMVWRIVAESRDGKYIKELDFDTRRDALMQGAASCLEDGWKVLSLKHVAGKSSASPPGSISGTYEPIKSVLGEGKTVVVPSGFTKVGSLLGEGTTLTATSHPITATLQVTDGVSLPSRPSTPAVEMIDDALLRLADMHEPTIAMIEAGAVHLIDVYPAPPRTEAMRKVAREVWKKMVDARLRELDNAKA